MNPHSLKIMPLGGLGEIGMNCMALECGDSMVLIDCGVQFPDASYPGVELLLPDLSYVRARLSKLKGVVVTHGHDDHIGAIPYLSRHARLNVFCTPFPKGLLTLKMKEFSDSKGIRYHEIEPRKSFSVGPFRFNPISVHHSIIESLAFVIETPAGIVVHTGDFKHDPEAEGGKARAFAEFKPWSKKGISLLLSDSTNSERLGHTLSEKQVARTFEKILAAQRGRTFIALFASNIRRVENLLRIAKKLHKRVAFCGRSMHSYTQIAYDLRAMKVPSQTVIDLSELDRYDDRDLIILATGSQAEPKSALVRIARGEHKLVRIRSGDRVIMSSRFIPGNERAITSMIDHLYREGAQVLYESIEPIHVSGHGFQDELLMMLKAVRPEFFVPVHGEYRHLKKHASLAESTGVRARNIFVIENGQSFELDRHGMQLGEKLDLQKVAITEGMSLAGDAVLFAQRSSLARTGVVFVAVVRDEKSRQLLTTPQVTFHGLLFREGEDPAVSVREARELVEELSNRTPSKEDLSENIRLEVRRFYKKRVSHRPVVVPMVIEVA